MKAAVTADPDFAGFVRQIKLKSGIDLSLYKETQMKRRLAALRDRRNFRTFGEYARAMAANEEMYREFLGHMTINVSEFYRNPARWDQLEKAILPDLLKRGGSIKIWSAACSTGEEPYSLVMAMSAHLPLGGVQVLATDLDADAIAAARIGAYSADAVKNVPKPHLANFFTASGGRYTIAEEIKRRVTFRRHNLLSDPYETDFDLIVCRNVLIYFTEEAKESLFMKFSRSLRTGGCLFIGGTEQIVGPQRYGLKQLDNFFYRKV